MTSDDSSDDEDWVGAQLRGEEPPETLVRRVVAAVLALPTGPFNQETLQADGWQRTTHFRRRLRAPQTPPSTVSGERPPTA